MTLQPRPNNPIEARKQAVRRYSRNGVACVGGGVLGLSLIHISEPTRRS